MSDTSYTTQVADLFVPECADGYFMRYLQDNLALVQNFMDASGTKPIKIVNADMLTRGGQYLTKMVFDRISGTVSRRNIAADPGSALTTLQLTANYEKGPVCNLKFGPFRIVQGSEWMNRLQPGDLEREIARQCAEAFPLTLRSYIVNALYGALNAFTAAASGASFAYDHAYSIWNNSTAAYLTAPEIAKARQEMGDRQDKIMALLARSEILTDVLAGQLAPSYGGLFGVAGVAAQGGPAATLGLAPIACDEAILKTDAVASSSTKAKWLSMLLGAGVVEVEIVRAPTFSAPQPVNNEEEKQIIFRGDADIRISIPGMTYAGTANPTTGTLATTGSWTLRANDHREFAVVGVETNSIVGG
jgi:hypothetical protein